MEGLSPNLRSITHIQVECLSFFEATPKAAKNFAENINNVCKKNRKRKDEFIKVEVTLEHREKTEWSKSVNINAKFIREDGSSYSYGCTYWSRFNAM